MADRDKRDDLGIPAGVGDIDGFFEIEVREEKIYLKVVAPGGDGLKVKFRDVIENLREKGFKDFEKELVKNTVEQATGQEVIIGTYVPPKAQAKAYIENHGFQAYLHIVPPAPGGEHISKEDIKRALQEAGVIFGVKESVIDEIVAQPRYDEDVLVAEGVPPKNGVNASFEFKVDIDKDKPRFKTDETGAVDLKEMNLIENVVEGQLLAVKIPAKQGDPGLTVQNKQIPPKPARDLPWPAGKNVRISDDGLELYSEINGMVSFTGGKISVDPVYEVRGNVSTETGNINFIGSVIVHGSVEDGFSIKAEGDIEVKQTVGKAKLDAGGDIIVRQGIVGHNEAEIRAGGKVRARHIQEAKVVAGTDVLVSEAIMHSHVEAGERVILFGNKRLIVGGTVIAFKEINARTAGSPMSTKTNLEVGIRPALREEQKVIEETISKDKKNLDQVEKGLTTLLRLKKVKRQLPKDKEDLIRQLAGVREGLKKNLAELMKRFDEIQHALAQKTTAKVCIAGDAYSGVKVGIRTLVLFLTKNYTFTTFFEDEGEVRTRSYEEPRIDAKALE